MVSRLRCARGGLFVLFFTLLTSLTLRASAADVAVEGRGVAVDRARLRALVALELGARADAQGTLVSVVVNGELARVTLSSPDASPPASAEIDLGGSADPERALALLVGVLATPSPSPSPPSEPAREESESPAPTNVVATPEREPPKAPRSIYGLASIDVRVPLRGKALVIAPHVEAGMAWRSWGRAGLLVRYAHASADDPLGTIDAHAITGGPLVSFRLFERGRFALGAGPRAELGVAWASGRGVGGRAVSGEVLVGAMAAEASFALAPLRVIATLEGGWTARGFTLLAEGRRALELSGPFLGAGVGFAMP